MLDLSIVIVSFNTRELLRQCLESVFQSRGEFSYQVYVVDNSSSDGSAALVRERFPQVHLMECPANLGYAYANNLALRECRSRYLLLLNPDTLLPPEALQGMLEFMGAHPEAGASGPKLVRENGELDLACRRSFPSPEVSFHRLVGLAKLFPKSHRFGRYNLTYLPVDEVAEVDSVVGAFMMVREEAVKQVGLLDESFFMYGEDLDWAFRMKEAGWKIYYNPEVTVRHYKGASIQKNQRQARYEFYRAMHIFYQKHYAETTPRWLHWLVLAGIILRGGLALAGEIGPWRKPRETME